MAREARNALPNRYRSATPFHRYLGLSAHSTLFVITCARVDKAGKFLAFSPLSSPQVDANQDATDARDRRLLLYP
jgi:hypothetical protein